MARYSISNNVMSALIPGNVKQASYQETLQLEENHSEEYRTSQPSKADSWYITVLGFVSHIL